MPDTATTQRRYVAVDPADQSLRIERDAIPSPGPGEVLIRVSAAGLNRADLLQRKGLAMRITTDEEIEEAKDTPPQTTRAKLRGEFITAAQEAGRDFTVDWVHLKLNDQAQRTVLCKDPFRAVDERVKRLIASM